MARDPCCVGMVEGRPSLIISKAKAAFVFPSQVQPGRTLCKCCGNVASLFDVCDFHKSCEEAESKCPHCGGTDLVKGVTLSQPVETGSIGLEYRKAIVFSGTETLYADLCRACGSITRLYVKEADRNWNTK